MAAWSLSMAKDTTAVGAMTFDRQLEKLSTLSKHVVNRVDIFGRTLLHLAATVGNLQIVEALLDNLHIDTSLVDLENGWTALHRALASGNIGCAQLLFQRDLALLRDRSNYNAFEVFNSSIDLDLDGWDNFGTEVFTFGSNANHTLGFADQDDRQNPGKVKLERESKQPNFRKTMKSMVIENAAISKLHSVILADGRVYACGVSRGGRLGTGSTTTQFTYTKVLGLDKETVVDVSLGLDHTVVVTDDGSVYTWGSNKSAQLGYSSDAIQYEPRKVLTSTELRSSKITKCSASNIHTVAYNHKELYFWGTNIGQMGFTSIPDAKVGAHVLDTGGITEPCPRKVAINHGIIQAIATDVATIILFDNHDVRVFMNGGNIRVPVPTGPTRNDFDVFRSRSANATAHVVQIAASGNGTVCMLNNFGVVMQFHLSKYVGSTEVSVTQMVKQLKIHTLWKPQKSQMRAKYVDCANDGSFIICVENGSVWKRSKSKRGTVIERVPLVNRVQRVLCDSNFASFMAIRQDLSLDPATVRLTELSNDLECCLSYMPSGVSRKSFQLLRGATPEGSPNNYFVEQHDEGFDDDEYWDRGMARLLANSNVDSLKMRFEGDCGQDMKWQCQKCDIPVHSAIIQSRIPKLQDVNGYVTIKDSTIQFADKVHLDTAIVLLHFLYTDKVVCVWEVPGHNSVEAKDQVLELASKWGLDTLRNSIIRRTRPVYTLDKLNLGGSPSIKILLKDGVVMAHKFMLEARCSYFEALFSPGWNLTPRTQVDLSHVTKQVFELVLEFLYTDKMNDLFDHCGVTTTKAFIRLVLDTMRVADELSVLRLKEVCESVLCSFVTVKNCGKMLMEALECQATQLRDRVLYYICHNLDCLLENNFLQDLDHYAFGAVDDYMGRLLLAYADYQRVAEPVFWTAFNDLFWHDEQFARQVPHLASRLTFKAKRRQSSMHNEKPSMQELKNALPAKQSPPQKTQSLYTPSKQQQYNEAISPPSPPHQTKHTPEAIKIGDLFPNGRRKSSTSLSSSPPVQQQHQQQQHQQQQHQQPPFEQPKHTPEAIKIGDLFANGRRASSSTSPSTGNNPTTPQKAPPRVIEAPKLSQKERRKMQQRRDSSLEPVAMPLTPSSSTKSSASSSTTPWGGGASANGGAASQAVTPPQAQPSESPFAALKSKKSNAPPQPKPEMTLRDIIQQEQRTVQQRQQTTSRSLKEIQDEEKFQRWWELESAKYQQQPQNSSTNNNNNNEPFQNGNGQRGGGNRGNRGGGRGNSRGRGRGGARGRGNKNNKE